VDEEVGLELVAVDEMFALVLHDAVTVIVAMLDPFIVLVAVDVDSVATVAATELRAVSELGVPSVDEDDGFRCGGGVNGVNCCSIPS